jgi:predicted DCC family thiol-disulfide oxidoreductase YuxK
VNHLVLYDGVCGLCNRSVRAILKADCAEIFLFATLQSETGQKCLTRYGHSTDRLESLILVVDYGTPDEQVLLKSEAALFVARQLGGWWRLWSLPGFLPRSFLDRVYDLTARNRYRWFGKLEFCPLPDKRQRQRFIADVESSS